MNKIISNVFSNNSRYTQNVIRHLLILIVILLCGGILSYAVFFLESIITNKMNDAISLREATGSMLSSIASEKASVESLQEEMLLYDYVIIDKNVFLSNLVEISNRNNVDIVKVSESGEETAAAHPYTDADQALISTKIFAVSMHGTLDNLYNALIDIQAISRANKIIDVEMMSDSISSIMSMSSKNGSILALVSDQKFLYNNGYTEIPVSEEFTLSITIEYITLTR